MTRKVLCILFLFFSLHSEEEKAPIDQLLVVFGSSGYILYKVLDFAYDHGFQFIKILSYEFNAFDHKITGAFTLNEIDTGRTFELQDENSKVSFLCFKKAPDTRYAIDVKKYLYLLDHVKSSIP